MRDTTIEQVIAEMRAVTDRAEREGSRLGYFSALYARVTSAVAARIRAGFFDDGARMERLDVTFASLYLDAVRDHLGAGRCASAAWRVAFAACGERDPTLLQHIYLGMNAHLLVDLPAAVVATCPDGEIAAVRADFRRINAIVSAEMGAFHEALVRVSPGLTRLHRRAGRGWSAASYATLASAREIAWRSAEALARRAPVDRPRLLARLDSSAALLGRQFFAGPVGRILERWLREAEGDDVRQIIRALR